jgi:hypothetical protein
VLVRFKDAIYITDLQGLSKESLQFLTEAASKLLGIRLLEGIQAADERIEIEFSFGKQEQ